MCKSATPVLQNPHGMLLEMASDSPFMAASGREGCSDVTWSTAQMERQGAKPRLDQKHLLGCGQ